MLSVLLVLAACSDRETSNGYRRGAPTLPSPGTAKRIEFFFELYVSGEQTEVGGKAVPTWQRVGERALLRFGPAATDYILDPARYKRYRRSSDILSNVLHIVPRLPGASSHPRLNPFLLHWLDKDNCPQKTGSSDLASLWRKDIFSIFTRYPQPPQAVACVGELDRTERVHDLRTNAIFVLLKTRNPQPVLERWDALPQVLRSYTLARLHELAAEHRPAPDRDVARAFRKTLKGSLEAKDAYERVYAAATLFRLKEPLMPERLLVEFGRAREAGNEDAAWVAIRALMQDIEYEPAFAICWENAQGNDRTFAWTIANELLRKHAIQRPAVPKMLWARLEASDQRQPLQLEVLLQLMRIDRARVLKFLKRALIGDNPIWRNDALRFIRTRRSIPEAGPWIIRLLQPETNAGMRGRYYDALLQLRDTAALPMLRADLDDASDPALQKLAAEILVASRDKEGIARIGERLKEGDVRLLDVVAQRAHRVQDGIPDQIIPAVLHVLKTAPAESARLQALFIIRAHGRLEGVKEGLIEAYRREPSRRVAGQIETTLHELAHR